MGTIIERLEFLRQEKGLNKTQFSEAIGVSGPHYAQILAGRNKVSADHLLNLYAYFDKKIDLHWVFTGDRNQNIQNLIIDKEKEEANSDDRVTLEQETQLYNKVREGSEALLSFQQEKKLRMACRKTIMDNEGATLEEMEQAGKVYLMYILKYPDLEL